MNSNNAFVAESSGRPRSALILLCVVSLAPKTVTGTPASFSTLPRRRACAVVSGCSATCRIRNGGILLSVHCDNAEWTRKAKSILKATGAHDIAATEEASRDLALHSSF